jgi:hypothetical protein
MTYHVLAVNSFRPLPPEVLTSSLIGKLTVITEPAHVRNYPTGVDVFTVNSIDDFTAVRDTALTILSDRRIDAVLCPTELGVAVCGLLRSYFGIPGMGFDVANAFSNKYVMKLKLAEADLPVTPFRMVPRLDGLPAAAEDLGWPIVVKRCFGGGTMDVAVIESASEFSRFYRAPESAGLRDAGCPLIAEQFVDIEAEYHCDGIVDGGTTKFASVSKYLSPVLTGRGGIHGSFHLSASDPDAESVRRLHQDVVRALGMHSGVTHLEVFKTASGLLVGEIACRPGGGGIVKSVALQYGVDLWRAFIETSLGLPPTIDIDAREETVVNVMLPARPGRILDLSPAEHFANALPGVLDTTMVLKPGDIVDDVAHSMKITGLVFLTAPSVHDIDDLVQSVSDTYVLRTEPY